MSCMPDPNAPPEACGGCDGTAPSTPAAIINRAGLGTLRYRIGTHAQFRESMLAGLSSSRYQLARCTESLNTGCTPAGMVSRPFV
jgi:hypothetical protein